MEGGGRPADSLRFAEVMVETGRRSAGCRAPAYRNADRLEPVPDRLGIDLRSLYNGNLISGVVSGLDWAWW